MFRLVAICLLLSLADLVLTLMLLAYRSDNVYESNPIANACLQQGTTGIITHKLLWTNVFLAVITLITLLGTKTKRWAGMAKRANIALWVTIIILSATVLYSASLFLILPPNQTP